MIISSNVAGDSTDENTFSRKLSLTNRQVSKLHKVFANGSSAHIKISKTQFDKIGQSGGFLGRLFEPLLRTGLHLIGNVLKLLAKSVLIPLLAAAASATDIAIHKKMFGSGTTILIISNEEIIDITKIIKFLEESGLLIKEVSKTIKNEAKEWHRFLSMLLGTLVARLLGNLLTGKGTITVDEGTFRNGESTRIFNAASFYN